MATSPAARGERAPLLARTLLRATPGAVGADFALLAVRVALVWIFTYYGAGKLFGWFHGPGLNRTAVYFAGTAHLRPGMFFAVLGGVIEFGGACAMALGLLTRVAGLALAGDQIMAMITVTWTNGINSLSTTPGYEFNLTLCVLSVVVVIFGAGRLSVDTLWGRRLQCAASSSAPVTP
ncbi:MAG: DoxX family protein [Acidimicrobiaceae bacterium]|nr:DoxX family protein [Acidimicrobiaceae bacterium]